MVIPSGIPIKQASIKAPKIRTKLALRCSTNVAPAKPSTVISIKRCTTSKGDGKKIGLINPPSVAIAQRAIKNKVEQTPIKRLSPAPGVPKYSPLCTALGAVIFLMLSCSLSSNETEAAALSRSSLLSTICGSASGLLSVPFLLGEPVELAFIDFVILVIIVP